MYAQARTQGSNAVAGLTRMELTGLLVLEPLTGGLQGRGTSLIILLGPYSRTMPGALW